MLWGSLAYSFDDQKRASADGDCGARSTERNKGKGFAQDAVLVDIAGAGLPADPCGAGNSSGKRSDGFDHWWCVDGWQLPCETHLF